MTPVETLRGAKVALFGLGGSGLSTLRALVAGSAEVSAWDDTEGARANAVIAELESLKEKTAKLYARWEELEALRAQSA